MRSWLLVSLLALAPMAACGTDDGDATPTDGTPTPTADGATPTETPVATAFTATEIQTLLTSRCTPCHVGGGSSGGLQLDSFHSATVGEAANQASLNLIEAGDAEGSYLYRKLEGTQSAAGGSGSQMPQGGPFFTGAELASLEAWILDGAPNN